MHALRKVKSGDALEIPAATFNTFIDAARDFLARQQESAQNAQPGFRSSGIILVKNASGYNQDRLAVLGINKKGWEYMWVRYADAEVMHSAIGRRHATHLSNGPEKPDCRQGSAAAK